MINQESFGPGQQSQSSFAEALQLIESKYGITTTDLPSQKDNIRRSIDREIEQLLLENFRIPVAVLMAKINEIARQFKPMELQMANAIVADIQAGKNVGGIESLMARMSLFDDGGGSNRGGYDRSIRHRAEFFILLILISLLFAACAPPIVGVAPVVVNEQGTPQSVLVAPAESTNTAVPPTETAIPATATEMPTQTPTEVVIPDWANPFFEGGFDSKVPNRPNSQYMIIRDGMHKSFNGLNINGIKIFDVIYGVGYMDHNGVFRDDGIIINGACKENFPGSFHISIGGATSIKIEPFCPSQAFFEGQAKGYDEGIEGDSTIIVALIGSGHENQNDRDRMFRGFFEKNPQIPGVRGVLLEVQNYYYNVFEK